MRSTGRRAGTAGVALAGTLAAAASALVYTSYGRDIRRARYSAEHIPGARFISFPSGGHLWVGHHEEILAEVAAFLMPLRGASR